jgi:hypothetical protein
VTRDVTRRSALSALLAPLGAFAIWNKAPKRSHAAAWAYRDTGHTFYELEAEKDFDFLAGQSWTDDKVLVTEYWPLQNRAMMFVDRECLLPDPERIDQAMRDVNAMLDDWNSNRIIRIMNPDGTIKFTNINS